MRSTQVLQFFPQRVHVVPAHDVVSRNGKFSEPSRCAPIPNEVYSFQTGIFRELDDRLADLS
jgi:hypothetical protein